MKLRKLFKKLGKKVSPATKLVARERYEQIYKHGFNFSNDKYYVSGELAKVALFCLSPTDPNNNWPLNLNTIFKEKILKKDQLDRMVVAAALLTAEADRLILSVKMGNTEKHAE